MFLLLPELGQMLLLTNPFCIIFAPFVLFYPFNISPSSLVFSPFSSHFPLFSYHFSFLFPQMTSLILPGAGEEFTLYIHPNTRNVSNSPRDIYRQVFKIELSPVILSPNELQLVIVIIPSGPVAQFCK
jgi:hypothetical protein